MSPDAAHEAANELCAHLVETHRPEKRLYEINVAKAAVARAKRQAKREPDDRRKLDAYGLARAYLRDRGDRPTDERVRLVLKRWGIHLEIGAVKRLRRRHNISGRS
jgi:hypothetical protein